MDDLKKARWTYDRAIELDHKIVNTFANKEYGEICYSLQYCIRSLLKAMITMCDHPYPETDDIMLLSSEVQDICWSDTKTMVLLAKHVDPYATMFSAWGNQSTDNFHFIELRSNVETGFAAAEGLFDAYKHIRDLIDSGEMGKNLSSMLEGTREEIVSYARRYTDNDAFCF